MLFSDLDLEWKYSNTDFRLHNLVLDCDRPIAPGAGGGGEGRLIKMCCWRTNIFFNFNVGTESKQISQGTRPEVFTSFSI